MLPFNPSVKPATFRSSVVLLYHDSHLYSIHQQVPSSLSPNLPSVSLATSIFTTSVTISYLNYCPLVAHRVHCVLFHHWISSVQLLSCVWLRNPMDCSMPGFPVHHQLPELAQTHVQELVMPSKHLILCHSLPLLPSIFPSIRVFSNESVSSSHPVAKVLKLRLQHQSFQWTLRTDFFFFRMDFLDLLAVQGTLKSLLQHRSSKASMLWRSAFIIVQLSHPYMTTGKTIGLTRHLFWQSNVSAFQYTV